MHFPTTTTTALLLLLPMLTMSTTTPAPATKPHHHRLHALNTSQRPPSRFPFTLSIPPSTDLWHKPSMSSPPSAAPVISTNQPSFGISIPLSRLASAAVTLRISPEILYDQAGLVLLYPGGANWIKAGVEFVPELGGLKKSVVATRGWSDWSAVGEVGSGEAVVVSVEREVVDGVMGPGMVFKIGGELVREVTWGYADQDGGESEGDVWVGFYGARPAKEGVIEAVVEEWEVRVWK